MTTEAVILVLIVVQLVVSVALILRMPTRAQSDGNGVGSEPVDPLEDEDAPDSGPPSRLPGSRRGGWGRG